MLRSKNWKRPVLRPSDLLSRVVPLHDAQAGELRNYSLDLALITTMFELVEEVERLCSELRFMRHH